ncbi:MAG: hypothetical protein AAF517_01245, partial [Planctomycetota bacterium]
MLHPDFPVVEGRVAVTSGWEMHLPNQFNRRVENGDLIFWRRGFTVYLIVWSNDDGASAAERLASLRADVSPEAFDEELLEVSAGTWFLYRLV